MSSGGLRIPQIRGGRTQHESLKWNEAAQAHTSSAASTPHAYGRYGPKQQEAVSHAEEIYKLDANHVKLSRYVLSLLWPYFVIFYRTHTSCYAHPSYSLHLLSVAARESLRSRC